MPTHIGVTSSLEALLHDLEDDCQNSGASSAVAVEPAGGDRPRRMAGNLKRVCDELKSSGCPAYGGAWDEKISPEIRSQCLMLDTFLDRAMGEDIAMQQNEGAAIQMCRVMIAQGQDMAEFKQMLSSYDTAAKCGNVWESNAVAFRCNTCAFNPCMSLCAECFHAGDHAGHDFNRFFSQAGGACDCGDADVMKSEGFCARHRVDEANVTPMVPPDLITSAEFIVPKLFTRLFLIFREKFHDYPSILEAIQKFRDDDDQNRRLLHQNASHGFVEGFGARIIDCCDQLIHFISELIGFGGPMRSAIADILINQGLYRQLCNESDQSRMNISLDWRSLPKLRYAVSTLQKIASVEESTLMESEHIAEVWTENLLDELLFWTVRLIFPQSLVTLSLSLLPVPEYREKFSSAFFRLYPRISNILVDTAIIDPQEVLNSVGSRIIHISVQVLSSEAMTVELDTKLNLLHMLIYCSSALLSHRLIASRLFQDKEFLFANEISTPSSRHQVLDVKESPVLDKHAFWSVMSDLHNALGHAQLAHRFLRCPDALRLYVRMISHMQGMNVNWRIVTGDHVEYDDLRSFQHAFTAEWEAASMSMFSIVCSISSPVQLDCLEAYLQAFIHEIKVWMIQIGHRSPDLRCSHLSISFHIPLHRHLAAAITHMAQQGFINPNGVDPIAALTVDETLLQRLAIHPLRIQAGRTESVAMMWTRNGTAMRNQCYLHGQIHLNTAFLDLDIALLRFIAANVNPNWFMAALAESYYLLECFSFDPIQPDGGNRIVIAQEWVDVLIEGAFKLLSELLVVRIYAGMLDPLMVSLEVTTALATADLTYSKLKTMLPERGTRSDKTFGKNFDSALRELAEFREPDQGRRMQQGAFVLRPRAWTEHFCPTFQRMRVTHVRDYNDALQRYDKCIKTTVPQLATCDLWIPYRLCDFTPSERDCHVADIGHLLGTPMFFGLMQHSLFKLSSHDIGSSLLQLTIYLLTLSVKYAIQVLQKAATDQQNRRRFVVFSPPDSHVDFYGNGFLARYLHGFSSGETNDLQNLTGMFHHLGSGKESLFDMILVIYRRLLSETSAAGDEFEPVFRAALTEQLKMDIGRMNVIAGGGCAYVGRLISLLYACDAISKQKLEQMITIKRSSPTSDDVEMMDPDSRKFMDQSPMGKTHSTILAEKRELAKRRRAAVMAATQVKQNTLMKQWMLKEGLSQDQMDAMDTSEGVNVRNYECPICNDNSPATLDRPIGLIVRVHGNCALLRGTPVDLPIPKTLLECATVSESQRPSMRKRNEDRRDHYGSVFPNFAKYLQLPAGVELKSCGHYAHVECHRAYVKTVLDSLGATRGARSEFACPMCRGVANALLPLTPDLGQERLRLQSPTAVKIEDPFSNNLQLKCRHVSRCINQIVINEKISSQYDDVDGDDTSAFGQALVEFLELCKRWTGRETESYGPLSNHTYSLSLLQSNLELSRALQAAQIAEARCNRNLPIEALVQGSCWRLATLDRQLMAMQWKQMTATSIIQTVPERTLDDVEMDDVDQEEEQGSMVKSTIYFPPTDDEILRGSTAEERNRKREQQLLSGQFLGPPLLLFDQKTVLLRISARIISDPRLIAMDRRDLLIVVYQYVISTSIVQAVMRIAMKMSMEQFGQICQRGSSTLNADENGGMASIAEVTDYLIAIVSEELSRSPFVSKESLPSVQSELEYARTVESICLDIAIMTAMLWKECNILTIPEGFDVATVSFEELHLILTGSSHLDLRFSPVNTVRNLVNDMARIFSVPTVSEKWINEPLEWRMADLLRPPTAFDDVFRRFFKASCEHCGRQQQPGVCLVCATTLSLTGPCCRKDLAAHRSMHLHELEKHAINCCGSAACVFLSVHTTLVIIVKERRVAVWGSFYLDSHGEEDRNLKRGKPLVLSERRFERLRRDWLLQTFEPGWFSYDHLATMLNEAHSLSG